MVAFLKTWQEAININGKITEFRLAYGQDKEHKLWIASPDISALVKEASPLIDYEHSANHYFTLRNEAVYLNCTYESSGKASICLDILQTMPRFVFSAEDVSFADISSIKCYEIEVNSGDGAHFFPMEQGIGNCVYIRRMTAKEALKNTIVDVDLLPDEESDYLFIGQKEWFDDAAAIMRQVAEKYNLAEFHKKYWAELPKLLQKKAAEERAEEEKRKPKGLLAKIFSKS